MDREQRAAIDEALTDWLALKSDRRSEYADGLLSEAALLWLERRAEEADGKIVDPVEQGKAFLRSILKDDHGGRHKFLFLSSVPKADDFESGEPTPSWNVRREEARQAVRKAGEQLPPRQRELFLLLFQGLPQDEIAQRLEVAPASVSRLKKRMFKNLKKLIPPEFHDLS